MFILGSGLCVSGGFELDVGNLGALLDVDEPDDLVAPIDVADPDEIAAPLGIADLDDLAAPIDRSEIVLFSIALFMAAVSVFSIIGLLVLGDTPYFYLSVSSIVGAVSYILVSLCLLYPAL
ncbi:hypothetical protein [Candidatus Ichthyocystis sparus]|uniref:hypothetical protein n=1 Tax=Candidatus Ichthyocystis sparus TaxID=1561004 RepID=UPI000B8839CB|nr:hypothetical protein [Candidatus Ichthyocystis sparus]